MSFAPGNWRELHRLPVVRFATVGAITTAFDIAFFAAFVHLAGLPAHWANVCSYPIGIVISFILNRSWTFNDQSSGTVMYRRFAVFTAIYLVALAISTALVTLFSMAMPEVAAKILSVPLVFIWSYGAMRFFVFRGQPA